MIISEQRFEDRKITEYVKYKCPCCGFYTLKEKPVSSYEICPVCFWEVDRLQQKDEDYDGGANRVSLNTARENYARCGAIEDRFLDMVRKPLEDEK